MCENRRNASCATASGDDEREEVQATSNAEKDMAEDEATHAASLNARG